MYIHEYETQKLSHAETSIKMIKPAARGLLYLHMMYK